MGNLFVGEQPLAESPMKDHPLTPMRDSNLMRLLAPQVTRPVGLANRLVVAKGPEALRARLAALAAEGVAHVVVDAVADDDLHAIAEACRDMPLMTGGSAVAMPLPELWLREGCCAGRPAPSRRAGSGARGDRAVGELLGDDQPAGGGVPRPRARPSARPAGRWPRRGPGAALDWLAAQPGDADVRSSTPPPTRHGRGGAGARSGAERAGAVVEQALAACAVAARDAGRAPLRGRGRRDLGRRDAGRSAIARLDIGAEIAPGVPWCFADPAARRSRSR